MSWMLSIDPGYRDCGCALWRRGELVKAEFVSGMWKSEVVKENPVRIVKFMAERVEEWVRSWAGGSLPPDLEIVIEMMRTYKGRAAKGDANSLIKVSLATSGIFMHLDRPTMLVLPQDWKGGVPKKNRHGDNVIKERCLEKLSTAELSWIKLPAKSVEHNVWDAIGIGLRYLRNMGVRT